MITFPAFHPDKEFPYLFPLPRTVESVMEHLVTLKTQSKLGGKRYAVPSLLKSWGYLCGCAKPSTWVGLIDVLNLQDRVIATTSIGTVVEWTLRDFFKDYGLVHLPTEPRDKGFKRLTEQRGPNSMGKYAPFAEYIRAYQQYLVERSNAGPLNTRKLQRGLVVYLRSKYKGGGEHEAVKFKPHHTQIEKEEFFTTVGGVERTGTPFCWTGGQICEDVESCLSHFSDLKAIQVIIPFVPAMGLEPYLRAAALLAKKEWATRMDTFIQVNHDLDTGSYRERERYYGKRYSKELQTLPLLVERLHGEVKVTAPAPILYQEGGVLCVSLQPRIGCKWELRCGLKDANVCIPCLDMFKIKELCV